MLSTAWYCAQGCCQEFSNNAIMIFINLPRHKYLVLSQINEELVRKATNIHQKDVQLPKITKN